MENESQSSRITDHHQTQKVPGKIFSNAGRVITVMRMLSKLHVLQNSTFVTVTIS